jgi:hypothetical protein
MPVCIEKRGNKWRVVNCGDRSIEMNKGGTPLDGGGHTTKAEAQRQARAVNASLSRSGKI